ncbi:MAG: M24 family metallopeptidase [Gemmatimonadota bacterium]
MAFELLMQRLPEIQEELRAAQLDGWLLYDLHARNTVTAKLTGLGDLTRRYFVLIPAQGDPYAISHKIEDVDWTGWPWRRDKYSGWRELNAALRKVLNGTKRVAMEISTNDAVPAMDLVPMGVVELIRGLDVEVTTSADLVSRFYAAWSRDDLAAHRRAATVLMQAAHAAFVRLAREIEAEHDVHEGEVAAWVIADLAARGCGTGAETIVANGVNAANPHYAPAGLGARFKKGDVVLIDLWAKENENTVFADQTWMAYLGPKVPDRIAEIFSVVTGARDAAVDFLREAHASQKTVSGGDVDDVARKYIRARNYGDAFVHRTGHSIDQSVHGMGPNIDNLETNETRRLITGVAFSIEPGIYLANDVGMRSEINVYMGLSGPEVTTPEPQTEMLALLPND